MRLHPQIVGSLIAAILAIALAGEARSAAQSPDDTGNPPVLINRPVCLAVEMVDDLLRCKATERHEDRSHSLHRSVRWPLRTNASSACDKRAILQAPPLFGRLPPQLIARLSGCAGAVAVNAARAAVSRQTIRSCSTHARRWGHTDL